MNTQKIEIPTPEEMKNRPKGTCLWCWIIKAKKIKKPVRIEVSHWISGRPTSIDEFCSIDHYYDYIEN